MTVSEARRFVIVGTLSTVALVFAFFATAPALGFPLRYDQTSRFLELLVPVFTGYLGLAASFAFSPPRSEGATESGNKTIPDSRALLFGGWGVFVVVFAAEIAAFGYSNRASAAGGSGMSVDMLAQFMVGTLAVLTTVTGAAVAWLFRRD